MKLMSAAPLIFLALNSYAKDFKFCGESFNEAYGVSDVRMHKGKPNKIIEKSGDSEITHEFSRDGEILSKNWGYSVIKFNWNSGRLDGYVLYSIRRDKSGNQVGLEPSDTVAFSYDGNGNPYKSTLIYGSGSRSKVEYSYRQGVSGGGYKEYCVKISDKDISNTAFYWNKSGEIIEKGYLVSNLIRKDEEGIYNYLKNAVYRSMDSFAVEYQNNRLMSISNVGSDGYVWKKTWYDDNGFPSQETSVVSRDPELIKRRLFKYEVDDKGNWIKMSKYNLVFSGFADVDKYKPVLYEEKTRSISYFD